MIYNYNKYNVGAVMRFKDVYDAELKKDAEKEKAKEVKPKKDMKCQQTIDDQLAKSRVLKQAK
jgi:hypothetical protein